MFRGKALHMVNVLEATVNLEAVRGVEIVSQDTLAVSSDTVHNIDGMGRSDQDNRIAQQTPTYGGAGKRSVTRRRLVSSYTKTRGGRGRTHHQASRGKLESQLRSSRQKCVFRQEAPKLRESIE